MCIFLHYYNFSAYFAMIFFYYGETYRSYIQVFSTSESKINGN